MKLELKEHIPDCLDLSCDVIFRTLDNLELSTKGKIELLEQVLDYLRMQNELEQSSCP